MEIIQYYNEFITYVHGTGPMKRKVSNSFLLPSYQRFSHINEASEKLSIALTHQPPLHAALNKRTFA